MFRRIVIVMGVLIAAATTSTSAQSGKVEVGGNLGWVFSDGVSGQPILAGDGNLYDRVDPKDSALFGFNVGVLVTDQVELGFLYGLQKSKLEIDGTNQREVGDFSITGYHGYIAYNFGEADAPLRPFFLFGLGATNFGSIDVDIAGAPRTIAGETQFSTTIAGGLKYFFNPHVAAKFTARLTPTYIKTDPGGWWCDPYWGCYTVADAKYANQFQFNGGLTIRF